MGAGALALGLVVLVGCATTIDGRAAAGESVIASPTTGSTSRSTSSSSSTESTESSSSTESTSRSTTSDTSSSSSSTDSPTSSSSSSSSSSESSSSTASTTFTGNPDNLDLTAPGTELTFGAPAVLPFSYGDAEGVFTVNGLTVTQGSEADWAALGVDTSDAQGEQPWYLKLSLKQESGGDFSYTSVQDDLWAYNADGDLISNAYPGEEENALCPVTYAPDGFAVGDGYDACVVLSVNVGESVDRIQFEGGYDPDDPYYESPVVWKG